jgi:hypothetical protein
MINDKNAAAVPHGGISRANFLPGSPLKKLSFVAAEVTRLKHPWN